jgi:hypothetical protein
MIRRSRLLAAVDAGLRLSPVTAILGPRQRGKTTLAHEFARQHEATYFDLEDQVKLTNPKLVLEGLRGLVILDEIMAQ